MNAFQWDLRYRPAIDVPGFRTLATDDYPDTSDGPRVVPGTYSVVLQYGEQKIAQRLVVNSIRACTRPRPTSPRASRSR